MAPRPSAFPALRAPLVDLKTGMMTWTWLKQFQAWQQQLANGLDPDGNLVSDIEPTVKIVGRNVGLGVLLENIDDEGVVLPAGLPAATDSEQGAVVLPAGAGSNVLGSAALEPATAFDPAGAAAAAQSAAEGHADAAAAIAQTNAEAFASDASNLSGGTMPIARLSGIGVVIVTAALTSGGTQGSMTFTNGLLTAQVAAT